MFFLHFGISAAQTHVPSGNVDLSVAEIVLLRKAMMFDARKSILVHINSIADKCWPILLFLSKISRSVQEILKQFMNKSLGKLVYRQSDPINFHEFLRFLY